MLKSFLFATLACVALVLGQTATTGKLGDAAITENNPANVSYQAILPNSPSVQGSITGTSTSNGTGVTFSVNFSQFPAASLGPFLYHIHVDPVPSDGNCTDTLGHLDPYERGESPACNPIQPETCQVGDLSGKYGTISIPFSDASFQVNYLDLYTSTQPDLNSFFGNRSVVIHDNNLTRIACANFELAQGSDVPVYHPGNGTNSTSPTTSSAIGSSTASGSASVSTSPSKGGAAAFAINWVGIVALGGLVPLAL